ncbi:MAG: hypothetical protein IT364_15155 [Candidatus Hydrogenedentes bacterium]|nr:hypothetical protein [Candidatus Hydrogenedentota bacterium]
MLKIAGELLGHIEALWRVQVSELRNRDEYERYFKVEKPLNEMLIECQLRGLRVDLHRLEKRIDTLDDSLFLAKRELKTKWNVDDTDDLDHIRSRIGELFLPEDIDFSSRESLDSSLKLLGDTHPFLRCLKTFRDSRRDREILLRLGAFPAGRAFPTFECMGTVTGRVTLKDPPIQNLKRTSRDVFLPEEGFQFVYPDYSQFEPGIMADDSGDSQLISDYNAGDLYSSLSVALFGSVRERAAAKILFLSFCYGMSHSRMASFAARLSGESLEDCQRAIAEFFGRYTQLDEWQGSIEARLLTEGRVGSHMGNYRYRDSSGKQLSPIERRWAATQRIQGTASLILKKVMIRIFRECESIKMLIPMHDAVLCEVPQEVYDDCAKQLERLFIEEFHAECPSVEPRVTFNAFS